MFKQIKYLVEKDSFEGVLKTSSVLFSCNDKSEVRGYQIACFNDVWKDAYNNIPFYLQWKTKYHLPDSISDLVELEKWPILSKADIRENIKFVKRSIPSHTYAITSGSTGVPLKIPVWHDSQSKINMWIGRAANGICPDVKTFLIWGHHHLYGTGLSRIKNIIVRQLKDYILDYKRVSAYDTSVKAMNLAYEKYLTYKPDFFIGYSSSVLSFVRCNKNKPNPWSPKLVLCTAGPLSSKEKQEIKDFFHSSLCMEYGSVECGVMAYSVSDCSHYNVFWNTHLLQGFEDEQGGTKNIVTTLTKKYFPLIRYDIGDYLDLPDGQDLSSISKINSIIGRPTDIVTLKNGVSFFAMLIEACVEDLDGIVTHQLIVRESELEILLVGSRKFIESDYLSVRKKIFAVVPNIQDYPLYIRQVEELNKNKGGKTPIVIRK